MDRSSELFECIDILSGSKLSHETDALPSQGALTALVQRISAEINTNRGLLDKMEKL